MISRREFRCLAIVAVLVAFFATSSASAGGLSTQLGEVVIENLQIGERYNLSELANLRLPVTNTSEYGVHLKLEIVVPGESELKHDATPVPEKSWVALSDSLFDMAVGETIEADMFIQIPDDESHLGKKYQVMIWSHTVPGDEGGMFLACGLKSRIIFTIDTVRAAEASIGTAAPDFLLEPAELVVKDVPAGERYDLVARARTGLRITNTSGETHTFRVLSETGGTASSTPAPGYVDAPSASYLSFSQDEIILQPGESQEIAGFLSFPESEKNAGKSYMFIVHVFSVGKQVSSGKYSRLFVTVE